MTDPRVEVAIHIDLSLPQDLAQEAEERGLLSGESLGELLRQALRRERVDELFSAADRLASTGLAPLTDAELEAEIAAARAERRKAGASGR